MTKAELVKLLDGVDDDYELDPWEIRRLEREAAEERERRIEELEERQHESGFYAFQDQMWNWRNER